jgi:hypothetical protein
MDSAFKHRQKTFDNNTSLRDFCLVRMVPYLLYPRSLNNLQGLMYNEQPSAQQITEHTNKFFQKNTMNQSLLTTLLTYVVLTMI